MASKFWGVPLVAAGIAVIGIVLAIGWTCPTGGTGYCAHAYIAGGASLALGAGVVLFAVGVALIAAGATDMWPFTGRTSRPRGKRPPR